MILNINPFNLFFYRSCLYNSFFAILEYFNVSPLYILCFSEGSFILSEKNCLECKYIEDIKAICDKDVPTQLLYNAGIGMNVHQAGSYQSFIKCELDSFHPIIAIIDCYFMPYRLDVFEKNHYFHPVLINGYDTDNKTYCIIDQVNDDSLTYSYHNVGFYDLEQSLNYCKYKFNDYNDYYYFLSSYFFTNSKVSIAKIKEQSLSMKFKYYTELKRGIGEIKTYLECFDVDNFTNNIDVVLVQLNAIVNYKRVELYKSNLLFEISNVAIGDLANDIFNNWRTYRNSIYMYYCSSKKDRTTVNKSLITLLQTIYSQEEEYLDLYKGLGAGE